VAASQSTGVSSVRFFSCTPVDLPNGPENSADRPVSIREQDIDQQPDVIHVHHADGELYVESSFSVRYLPPHLKPAARIALYR